MKTMSTVATPHCPDVPQYCASLQRCRSKIANIASSWIGALTCTIAYAGTGAIYTSNYDGTIVNQNIYDAAEDVYLNGGPQNENSAGLDAGTYYFQVTDPSGTTLLSTDNAEHRQVVVDATGRIVGVPAGVGFHSLGTTNTANGSTPVQLAPFSQTPNQGGEYKAWLIGPVVFTTKTTGGPDGPTTTTTSNVTIDSSDLKVLVFRNEDSKTDNFKIKTSEEPDPDGDPSITISGKKYYDINANGLYDSGEAPVAGIQIEVTFDLPDSTTVVQTIATDAAGDWSVTPPSGATGFTACEVQPAPNFDGSFWMQTGPMLGDTTNSAEGAIVIDNHADYCWKGSLVGRTSSVTNLNFGNICVRQPTGGFTLGYWSNKNGQDVLLQNDQAWRINVLNPMYLKRSNGLDYDVPTGPFAAAYKDFRTWLLGTTATNMANMLSAQLTATTLDTKYKGLNPATLVYLPSFSAMQATLADCYGANVVAIGTVISEANDDLSLPGHENTTTGTPGAQFRDHQECLKNILDNVNNNKLLFVSPTPCEVAYTQ
jgi:hypothetical protein